LGEINSGTYVEFAFDIEGEEVGNEMSLKDVFSGADGNTWEQFASSQGQRQIDREHFLPVVSHK